MKNKSTAVVAILGLLLASIAFVLGVIGGANSAEVGVVRAEPNPLCFEDPNPDQESEQHVATKLVACQVVGMTTQAARDYISQKEITLRISSEDGETFSMTEDYRYDRINLDLLVGLVVGATAW
jgi:hypothetical protein